MTSLFQVRQGGVKSLIGIDVSFPGEIWKKKTALELQAQDV